MDPMQPVYSAGVLLLIAAVAVVVLLFLIIAVKMHAFLALVLVSYATGVAAGIPMGEVPGVALFYFGGTLGAVALLVGLGAMIGRLLEVSGGAQVLADTLINRFGEDRAPFALGVAALLFGMPIFFDAGLMVFLPIIFSVAKRFGGSVLVYALPAAGGFAAMHAIVPPHPGPVTAAVQIEASVGLTLLVGIPVAVLAWYFGVHLFTKAYAGNIYVPIDDSVLTGVKVSAGGTVSGDVDVDGDGVVEAQEGPLDSERQLAPPSFGLVMLVLLLPLALIAINTTLDTLIKSGTIEDTNLVRGFMLIGVTPVALLVTLLFATYTLGTKGRSLAKVESILNDALGPICAIILITGAGGMFGGVLRYSGIGTALSDSMSDLGLPLIVSAFVIATVLRIAQGSATVALTTASALITDAVAAADPSAVQLVALVLAIAAGATVLSHVNDSGFWLVSRFFNMDVKTTLRTWTLMETTLGLAIFVLAVVVWFLGAAVG